MKNSISSDMFACVMRRGRSSSAPVAAVELVVEPLHGRLLEDALAAGLALGAAQHDAPVARALLGPVQRIDELAGAVEADVQLVRRAGAGSDAVRERSCADDVDLLAVGQLHAVADVGALSGCCRWLIAPIVIDAHATVRL